MKTLSVSSLNEQIKALIESSFTRVFVEGEISRITFHNSGHIYFTLKDESSSLRAVMFRGNASKLRFKLEEGLKVVLDGAITLYKPRGEYQINCFDIQPSGHGALALAYEQLKNKLSSQGYFDSTRKKQLPKFPKKIAIITSATSAALQDMLRVANTRYKLLDIDIYDVLVQGEASAKSICDAIVVSDVKNYDIIIIGRGGGSVEDLWSFNEEILADAIYRAKTPIVSAVGHEIDWVISDFVADLRAATPSAAMEMILPDSNELLMHLDSLQTQLNQLISQKISSKDQALSHVKNLFLQHSIEKRVLQTKKEIEHLKEQFSQSIVFKIENFSKQLELTKNRYPEVINSVLNFKKNQLINNKKMLESNNPKFKDKRGFAQISKNNKTIELDSLKTDDEFEVMNSEICINAKVIKKNTI